eukprot:TRINITY_DN14317_c0_g1_i1.p1 TRINITY_DN14317_c0_g1~~TRINITY_DN14317_c0_g1_i1.p1  ORF type:complete len:548 (+),score=92.15 TRINITY_DN14317_c0_g1_i1:32-1675(+)
MGQTVSTQWASSLVLCVAGMAVLLASRRFLFRTAPKPLGALRAASAATTALSDAELVSRMKGAFFGSVVADALALGTHYEYDAQKIRQFYGNIDRYYAPGERTGGETHGIGWGARNFHNGNGVGPAKKAGECTDYGDYNILMLEHLAATAQPPRRIRLDELVPRWLEALPKWRSWLCTQTRQTYQQVVGGTPASDLGGMSNAMALRSAAAYGYFDKEEDVAHAARTMMFTHREETALDGGEFFARVAFRIIHGPMSPLDAIKAVASESSPFIQEKVSQALAKVAEASDPSSSLSKEEFVDDLALTSMARLWDVGRSEPIKVGKASPTEGVLPGSVYFVVKYNDFYEAARANSMVGGDCASRAVAIGMVLGAAQGLEGIPRRLQDTFVEWERLDGLLNQLPLISQRISSPIVEQPSAEPALQQAQTKPRPARSGKEPGPMQLHIEKKLIEAFAPEHLEVTNESHGKHSDESHFHVVIVTPKFEGVRLLERQRSINKLFVDESGNLTFHALRITAKTPAQWDSNPTIPRAPACSGKGDGRVASDVSKIT